MKSLWFVLFVCMTSQAFAQVRDFEDYMSLYHLNQSDVEERLGYSCNIYTNSWKQRKDSPSQSFERYAKVVHVGKTTRIDVCWGMLQSDMQRAITLKTNTLRGKDNVFRTRPNGQMIINDRPRPKLGVVTDLYEKTDDHEWFFSPFEIGYTTPSSFVSGGSTIEPIHPNLKCVKTEENGCFVWWNMLTYRHAAIKITFDKEVEYLPRSVLGIRSKTNFDVNKFNGEIPNWEKMKWFKFELEWQKLESEDLYVPKHIRGVGLLDKEEHVGTSDHSIDIHYTNWKVGDAVDKTLLDEEQFKKLEVRSFPFDDLIKAFPDHPPAIVK